MVRRRTTYAFSDLVLGRYSRRQLRHAQRHPAAWAAYLRSYLDQMTVDELLVLRTLDFDNIWGRVYGSHTPDAVRRVHFGADFLLTGCDTLVATIDQTRPTNRSVWEAPKGRKLAWESEAACAQREFWEETRVPPTAYTLTGHSLSGTWESRGQRYRVVYFLAWTADQRLGERLSVAQVTSIGEVDDLRWFRQRDLSDRWVANHARWNMLLGTATRQVRQWRQGCSDTWAEHTKNGTMAFGGGSETGSPAPTVPPDPDPAAPRATPEELEQMGAIIRQLLLADTQ